MKRLVLPFVVAMLVMPSAGVASAAPALGMSPSLQVTAKSAGFRDKDMAWVDCTIRWESSYNTNALHYNRDSRGRITSTDRGLTQVNDRWQGWRYGNVHSRMYDALWNLVVAEQIYRLESPKRWATYSKCWSLIPADRRR